MSDSENSLRQERLRELASLDELEMSIEKLVAGGDGLGRFKGIPIFVPRSAPGDRLRVRIAELRPQYARAEIVEVLEAGRGRREPPCAHFADCGGCDLQHIDDNLQAKLKVEAARETLIRIGGLELPAKQETVLGEPWAYRLRTQLHLESEESLRVGYFARGSHRLVEIGECPVLDHALETFVVGLKDRVAGVAPRRLDVAVGDDGQLTCAPALGGLPRGGVAMAVGGRRYHYDARTFFQGHRGLLETLIHSVVGDHQGGCAWDLYAGVGLFSLALAERYERVVAVEGDRVAVRYLRKNARLAGATGVEAVAASVEQAVKEIPEDVDRVVVDPPRAGLGFRVRAELFDRAVPRLTYVSCHAAVLARDLKHLCRIYELRRLTFIDLFPQTGHLEIVAQLSMGEGQRPS